VRQATDILHEIGRHLAGSVSAQRESIDAPTKAAVDCGDDLIVSAHRREEMGYVIWHLLRHLAPPSLPGQSIELVAEVFKAMDREHRVIGRRRAIERDALAHPFEAVCNRLVVGSSSEKAAAGNLVVRPPAAGFR